jgi:hypothetical protein
VFFILLALAAQGLGQVFEKTVFYADNLCTGNVVAEIIYSKSVCTNGVASIPCGGTGRTYTCNGVFPSFEQLGIDTLVVTPASGTCVIPNSTNLVSYFSVAPGACVSTTVVQEFCANPFEFNCVVQLPIRPGYSYTCSGTGTDLSYNQFNDAACTSLNSSAIFVNPHVACDYYPGVPGIPIGTYQIPPGYKIIGTPCGPSGTPPGTRTVGMCFHEDTVIETAEEVYFKISELEESDTYCNIPHKVENVIGSVLTVICGEEIKILKLTDGHLVYTKDRGLQPIKVICYCKIILFFK